LVELAPGVHAPVVPGGPAGPVRPIGITKSNIAFVDVLAPEIDTDADPPAGVVDVVPTTTVAVGLPGEPAGPAEPLGITKSSIAFVDVLALEIDADADPPAGDVVVVPTEMVAVGSP